VEFAIRWQGSPIGGKTKGTRYALKKIVAFFEEAWILRPSDKEEVASQSNIDGL
jgi:hypothetical protein